jgi:hypothetical protein
MLVDLPVGVLGAGLPEMGLGEDLPCGLHAWLASAAFS